ncbi:MAG: flavodoxin-dependent (E)-4-hydroxy-3-methylbut-2-enyl-diphosphate synthase [Negativicutes bacterium]|nr:flavodoxin-dependent (E)-4-hydroxy-3-methylbut-2-enyl-diphosphate synthase [Negativicutes bacterium]
MTERRPSRQIRVGTVLIGGQAPVVIQSMTNTKTEDIEATCRQIERLTAAGCELVRLAVPTAEAAAALREIKRRFPRLPLVADIHFDYRLALLAAGNGADGLRLNPGNIGSQLKIAEVVACARHYQIPIRIGVNAGSLERDLYDKHGSKVTADGLVESALRHVDILERHGFEQIKISIKAHSVPLTIDSYRRLATKVDYPLHLGITEAGTVTAGTVKSAVGIGCLLAEGIGDTIRVSLTGDPVTEVAVAKSILQALEIRRFTPELISCPTCGRTEVDLLSLAQRVEERLAAVNKPLTVAVMGCVVNGPGEAREADIGIAGGRGEGILFRRGKIIGRYPEAELLDALLAEIDRLDRTD